MALIVCPDCKKKVSHSAPACPNCGCVFSPEKIKQMLATQKSASTAGAIGSLVALAACSWCCFSGWKGLSSKNSGRSSTPSSTTASTPREIVSNSDWDASVRQVKDYLNQNLRDPASVEYVEWSNVVKQKDGSYMVRVKYRAKNGFGGFNLSNEVFMLDSQGRVTGAFPFVP